MTFLVYFQRARTFRRLGVIKTLLVALVAGLLAPEMLVAGPKVTSAVVESNGWILDVTLNSVISGTTFDYGFTTQNVGGCTLAGIPPGKLTLAMTSIGFDDNASLTTFARSVYGTRTLRCPYGINGQTLINYIFDVTATSTNTTVRLALSDYVYLTDSNLTFNVGANWYGANDPLSNLPVTNNSTNLAGRVVANWSRPPFQRVTNSTATVACVAFGHGAKQGRPVRCVQFWAIDEFGNTSPTNTVLSPTIDTSQQDPIPVIEYLGHIDVSSLFQSSLLTMHFAAYPWIGDSNSVLNTSDGRFSFPSMEATSTRLLLDRSNSFPAFVAVVSQTGSDTGGRVILQSAFDPGNSPAAYLTIGAAAQALATANAAFYARTKGDNMGSVIYVQPGSYSFTGNKTVSVASTPSRTWMTVAPFPGVSRDSVVIFSNSTTSFLSQCLNLQNITISFTNSSGAGILVGNTDYLWLDNCVININNASRAIDTVTNWYVTRCVVSNITQGLASAAQLGYPKTGNIRLIRGNTLSLYNGYYFPSTVLGNIRSAGTNTACRALAQDSFVNDPPSFPIIAFNKLMANYATNGQDLLSLNRTGSAMHTTNGLAIVQNVIELASGSTAAVRVASIASSAIPNNDTNISDNAYCWNNTFVGQRINWQENAGGGATSVPAQRNDTSLLNNYFDQLNSKDDLDYTSNGARTGNWPIMYGVGSYGNTDLDPKTMDSGWHWSFIGLNCISNKAWVGSGPAAPWATYAKFVNRRSGVLDGIDGAGNGDYRLTSTSPLLQVPTQWVLPYDIEGNPRALTDPPGAYSKVVSGGARLNSITLNPDGSVALNLVVTNSNSCVIEQSNDLNAWQAGATLTVTNGSASWVDLSVTNSTRFYRVRL